MTDSSALLSFNEREFNEFQDNFKRTKSEINKSRKDDQSKITRITLGLIKKHCVPSSEISILSLRIIELNSLKIQKIENLTLFNTLTHLNLHDNEISGIGIFIPSHRESEITDEISFMFHLQVLNLSKNRITKIQFLDQLLELKSLNMSHNLIDSASLSEFPSTLVELNLLENPMKKTPTRDEFIFNFDKLMVFNEKKVDNGERQQVGAKIIDKITGGDNSRYLIQNRNREELTNSSKFESSFDKIAQELEDNFKDDDDDPKLSKTNVIVYKKLMDASEKIQTNYVKIMNQEFDQLQSDFQRKNEEQLQRFKKRRKLKEMTSKQ